jgi:hypothetical protein
VQVSAKVKIRKQRNAARFRARIHDEDIIRFYVGVDCRMRVDMCKR